MATKKNVQPDESFGRAPEPEEMVVSEEPKAPVEVKPALERAPEPKTVVLAQYHGLSEDEANKVATSNGWVFRIGARDGESFAVTDDFVTNRVTVTIIGGKVTDVSVG